MDIQRYFKFFKLICETFDTYLKTFYFWPVISCPNLYLLFGIRHDHTSFIVYLKSRYMFLNSYASLNFFILYEF